MLIKNKTKLLFKLKTLILVLMIKYMKKNVTTDIFKEIVLTQDEESNFTAWSTPCANNCPGKKYYPKIHSPHIPLYPLYA